MGIQIFNQFNSKAYDDWCNERGLKLDIYYTPALLEQEATLIDGAYEIFTICEGNHLFLYPYIKRIVGPEFPGYYDITSPYGYCGPFCNNVGFFAKAELTFIEYIKTQNIITEFVRYHYLYNRINQFQRDISNIKNRTVVLLNTCQSWDDIWKKEFSGTNRNIIRKLEKEEYKFEIINYDEYISEFSEMYYTTMNNKNAEKYYFFEGVFFKKLKQNLGDKLFLTRIKRDNITYCMALFFASGDILTYYLSARNLNYPKIPASNLLLSKAAEWAQQNGCSLVNFGGGLSDDPSDSLFRFKCNFSQEHVPFYIGKRIHLQDKYKEIIRNWILNNGEASYMKVKHILQFYYKN